MMKNILQSIYELDEKGIDNENLFISGTVEKTRKDVSVPTPPQICKYMVNHIPVMPRKILEPCAGSGGILLALQAAGFEKEVTYNEIIPEKKEHLKRMFPAMGTPAHDDSLFVGTNGKDFDVVIMNPPFDMAFHFLYLALNIWTSSQVFDDAPPGGIKSSQIITLFPKLSLGRLFSRKNEILSMLSGRFLSIEDVPFDCSYGAKVVLIHIKK